MTKPAQGTSLARYDAACRALAEARSVDEVKDIRDQAVAMAAYARQAKNRDLEADAVEIRMRATRKLDELRRAQKETVGLAKGGGGKHGRKRVVEKPTLESQGIDKNLAHDARVLGALSEKEFEDAVADARSFASRAFKAVVSAAAIEQQRAKAGEPIPVAEVKGVIERHKGRQQPAKRKIAPHRQAMAEKMRRDFELAKLDQYERGNVSAKDRRAAQNKIITAGHHQLAKDVHPDHGGSHDEMVRLNQAREDLDARKPIISTSDWWKQGIKDIAAQMAKNFTIKQITELCAIANDLRKTKAAAAGPRDDDIARTGELERKDAGAEVEDLRRQKAALESENNRLRSEVEDLRRELAGRGGDPMTISEFQAAHRKWEDLVETQKNIIRDLQNENASLRVGVRDEPQASDDGDGIPGFLDRTKTVKRETPR